MSRLTDALAGLFRTGETVESVRAQLDAVHTEVAIETLVREGVLGDDADTLAAARHLHALDPAALDRVLRAPRQAPATVAVSVAAGPTSDPIDAAAAAGGISYTAAALAAESQPLP